MTLPTGYRQNVGILLLNKSGLLLACARRNMADAWQMPQGGIDDGEDAASAALRELEEETGITQARIIRPSATTFRYDFPRLTPADRWRGQEQRWFAMSFEGEATAIDVTRVSHPEFSGHAWITAAEMLKRIVAFKRPVYEAVFNDFSDILK